MFKPVPTKVDFVAQEHDVLKFWEETGSSLLCESTALAGRLWTGR